MDPISLVFFGILMPMAAAYTAFVIFRFKRNHKSQLRNFKADDITGRYDYDAMREDKQRPEKEEK